MSLDIRERARRLSRNHVEIAMLENTPTRKRWKASLVRTEVLSPEDAWFLRRLKGEITQLARKPADEESILRKIEAMEILWVVQGSRPPPPGGMLTGREVWGSGAPSFTQEGPSPHPS
jgi:hypothetical protein